MSYTYVEMPVSKKTYDEIRENLLTAGYEHAIHGLTLDMHGIALVPMPSARGVMKCAAGGNKKLPKCETPNCGKDANFIIRGRACCLEHKP